MSAMFKCVQIPNETGFKSLRPSKQTSHQSLGQHQDANWKMNGAGLQFEFTRLQFPKNPPSVWMSEGVPSAVHPTVPG